MNGTTEEQERERGIGAKYTYFEIPENKKRRQSLRKVLKNK